MGKLRKLLALVLIGAVISLGGLGCKKKAADPAVKESPAKETKTGESNEEEHPAGEHPAGEKEHPTGEHPK